MSALAELLEERQEELLQRWTDRLREQEAPRGPRHPPELEAHLPRLLRELVATLRGGAPAEIDAWEPGERRLRADFDARTLALEYGLLHGCVLELAEERHLSLPLAEVRALAGWLTTGVGRGVEQERQIRLSSLFAEAPAAIAHLRGPGHVFDFANRRYLQLVGGRDVLNRSVRDVLPEMSGQEFFGLLDRVYASDAPYHANEMLARWDRHGDGRLEEGYINFVYQPTHDGSGAVDGILMHAVEVTELVRARQRAELLSAEHARAVDALESGVPFLAVDKDWRITLVNRAQERVSGRPREQTLGRSPWELFLGQRPVETKYWHEYQRAMRERVAVSFEEHYQPLDLWTAVNAYPSADGGLYIFFLDVTAQKRAEAELQQRAEFERQLIGIVSHDLRSPLNTINLSVELQLRRRDLDARMVPSLERIRGATDRATRLIRDLLDYTQARLGGGLRVNRAPMNLHESARQVVEELRLAHPDRELRLEQSGDGGGEWDGDRVAQALTNLVGNAVKYSPPDTPVTVRTRGERDGVVLEVHNTGAPIHPDVLARLFQPLQRGSTGADPEGRSVGLGLYIVAQIARAHGGDTGVTSEEAAGTTFRLRLPRRPEAQARSEGAPAR